MRLVRVRRLGGRSGRAASRSVRAAARVFALVMSAVMCRASAGSVHAPVLAVHRIVAGLPSAAGLSGASGCTARPALASGLARATRTASSAGPACTPARLYWDRHGDHRYGYGR